MLLLNRKSNFDERPALAKALGLLYPEDLLICASSLYQLQRNHAANDTRDTYITLHALRFFEEYHAHNRSANGTAFQTAYAVESEFVSKA
jgi:hypothetical protein